ncbi:Vacuolar protein-sorting-associated protein 27 [Nowakowskiella sp. JEL0078]|nr:Vacuolar protein-sorting-associated protein 27 [Nowakowskiella sp. JEL0078]
MAFWLSAWDQEIEKITSENLPVGSEDVTASLDFADKVKSKEFNTKQTVQSLKKRINNKNPNVQLLTLKNTNKDVREKIYALIQSWGLAFRSKPDLKYVSTVYDGLKKEGVIFPKIEQSEVSFAMIETATAPEWTDSDHHCRSCGQCYDQSCSSKSIPLPQFGITHDVRVCDGCFVKIIAGVGSPKIGSPKNTSTSKPVLPITNEEFINVTAEEDELQKAIRISLEESQKNQRTISSYLKPKTEVNTYKPPVEDDDDADLKAAIEESLREAEKLQNRQTNFSSSTTRYSSSGGFGGFINSSPTPNNSQPEIKSSLNANNYTVSTNNSADLSQTEQDNMKYFADLVERMEEEVAIRGISVFTSNPQIPLLYGQITTSQQKLLTSLDETAIKYRSVYELQDKLAQALKTYDHLLQQRIAGASFAGYSIGSQPHSREVPNVPPTQFGYPQTNQSVQQNYSAAPQDSYYPSGPPQQSQEGFYPSGPSPPQEGYYGNYPTTGGQGPAQIHSQERNYSSSVPPQEVYYQSAVPSGPPPQEGFYSSTTQSGQVSQPQEGYYSAVGSQAIDVSQQNASTQQIYPTFAGSPSQTYGSPQSQQMAPSAPHPVGTDQNYGYVPSQPSLNRYPGQPGQFSSGQETATGYSQTQLLPPPVNDAPLIEL